MRIQIPLVVEMTDEQVNDYAAASDGAPIAGPGRPRAKDVVDEVRKDVLALVQGYGLFPSGAIVTIKR